MVVVPTKGWKEEDNFALRYKELARHILVDHGISARWLAIYIECDQIKPVNLEICGIDFFPYDISGQEGSFDIPMDHKTKIIFKRSHDLNYRYNGFVMDKATINDKIATDLSENDIIIEMPNRLLNDGVNWIVTRTDQVKPNPGPVGLGLIGPVIKPSLSNPTKLGELIFQYNEGEEHFYYRCVAYDCYKHPLPIKILKSIASTMLNLLVGGTSIRDAILSLNKKEERGAASCLRDFCKSETDQDRLKNRLIEYFTLLCDSKDGDGEHDDEMTDVSLSRPAIIRN